MGKRGHIFSNFKYTVELGCSLVSFFTPKGANHFINIQKICFISHLSKTSIQYNTLVHTGTHSLYLPHEMGQNNATTDKITQQRICKIFNKAVWVPLLN